MSMEDRFARLDSSSRRLTYAGEWSDVQEERLGWQQSFRRLNSESGTLQFKFRGTQLYLDGNFDNSRILSCTLNDVPLTRPTADESCFYNYNLTVDDYDLRVQIRQGRGLELYGVQYQPDRTSDRDVAARTDLEDAHVVLRGADKNISWARGDWTNEPEGSGGPARWIANRSGATVNITFLGIGLDIMAINRERLSRGAASNYVLDGAEPVEFQLPTEEGNGQLLLHLENLCYATHTLSLRYTADPATVPLSISDGVSLFLPSDVSNPPACSSTLPTSGRSPETVTAPAPDSSSTTTASTAPSKPTVTGGTIAGAVVGAVLGVIILLAIFLFLRRRRHREEASDNVVPMQQNPDYIATPFRANFHSEPVSPPVSGKGANIISSQQSLSSPVSPVQSTPRTDPMHVNDVQHLDSGLRGGDVDEEARPGRDLPPVYTRS